MALNNSDELATFKVLLLGDSKVGKSSLLLRYFDDKFNEETSRTIGVDIKNKKINVDGIIVNVAFWDTAGHERYRTLAQLHYRDAQAAIFVYDVTSKITFDSLLIWKDQIATYSNKTGLIMMLIGNKTDRKHDRIVAKAEGARFAARNRMMYLETSAKTDEGVTVAFEEIVRKIMQTPGLWKTDALKNAETLKLTDGPIIINQKQQNKRCCLT